MPRTEILRLALGFKRFREKYFQESNSLYQRLAVDGQTPKTLVIACSDSRVDPALMTTASPGEIFVVRNVANLVPPFEGSRTGFHGVSAAIEFAVLNLKVKNIIVLGHRQCGGIRALMEQTQVQENSFVSRWMVIADDAKQRVIQKQPLADMEEKCKACEKEAIVGSLKNLLSFPFVESQVKSGKLTLFGIFFDLEQGELLEFNGESGEFIALNV